MPSSQSFVGCTNSVALSVDVLKVTSTELQKLLSNGAVRSVELVDIYLRQIERENHHGLKLNAMISTTPRDILDKIAESLDIERQKGVVRGPLHGIPITVKDNIMTGPDFCLPTTVGSFALEKAFATSNAPIVNLILKENEQEMTGWKGFGITTGWSALGGQTQNPYVVGGFKSSDKLLGHSAPAGSSSGSAAGVAAGFSPIALATETDGSIVQPSNRAALYGMKATVGSISTKGTAPWSPFTDSIGGMAKSPQDLAALFIGVVDPNLWSFSPVICDPDPVLIQQQREELEAAIAKIQKDGARIKRPVPLTSMDELILDGADALEQIWNHDFNTAWKEYLQDFNNIDIKSISYPGQQLLEESIDKTKIISHEKYQEVTERIRKTAGAGGIEKTLIQHDLDVILGPMDGRIPTIAAAAGYPVGTMPLGYSKSNGRPFGVCIIAGENQEQKILRAMSAWEVSLEERRPPPQMDDRHILQPRTHSTTNEENAGFLKKFFGCCMAGQC
ncbi:amidase signature enzyme [Nemania sp. FL0916]|nr:amidase signature enzyme [Nemania sp. FL0916]